MFSSKKLNFWRLAFIFLGLTVIILFLLWTSPQEKNAGMMNNSMGNMMKQMHIAGNTIYQMFTSPEGSEQMKEMHSHHQNQSFTVFTLSFLSTSVIFLLLPFIIGGAILLAIVWIK